MSKATRPTTVINMTNGDQFIIDRAIGDLYDRWCEGFPIPIYDADGRMTAVLSAQNMSDMLAAERDLTDVSPVSVPAPDDSATGGN